MPSLFPGIDPFIEGHEWEDFHTNMITAMQAALIPNLLPDYLVRIEKRVYVEQPFGDPTFIRPDLTIVRESVRSSEYARAMTGMTATIEPVERTVPAPFEVQEKYLVIRKLGSSEVVTVIELLSPSNKRSGSEGRDEYLAKREDILQSRTNLVELDFLRGGERLPTVEPLPAGDFFAFVHRSVRRQRVDVYAWPLPHRLPPIPIPLSPGDREASLDLQAAFDAVYDRLSYDLSLDHSQPINPPLSKPLAKWVREVLKTAAQKS